MYSVARGIPLDNFYLQFYDTTGKLSGHNVDKSGTIIF